MDYNRIYTLDQTFFEKIDTEEKAYILGLMYSDGNVSWNDIRHQYEFCITLHKKDSYLLKKITDILGSNAPLKFQNNACLIKFSSKKMCQDLINLGCVPRKSLVIKFPTSQQVPKELLNHFIRGVFDGDGTISKKTNRNAYRVGFCGSKDFILSLLQELKNCNIKGNYLRNYNNPLFKELIYNRLEDVQNLYEIMYKNSTIYLDRKKERFEQSIELRNKVAKTKYINDILYKKCSWCKEFKILEAFSKTSSKNYPLGRVSHCKNCVNLKKKLKNKCGTFLTNLN